MRNAQEPSHRGEGSSRPIQNVKYRLTVVEAGVEREIPLTGQQVRIGRCDRSTVAIRDRHASREHCALEPYGIGYRLVDLGSRNGTRVNGEFVSQKVLGPGDRIEIGKATLRFESCPSTNLYYPRVRRNAPTGGTAHRAANYHPPPILAAGAAIGLAAVLLLALTLGNRSAPAPPPKNPPPDQASTTPYQPIRTPGPGNIEKIASVPISPPDLAADHPTGPSAPPTAPPPHDPHAPSPQAPAADPPLGPQESYLLLAEVDEQTARFDYGAALNLLDQGIERCDSADALQEMRNRRQDVETLARLQHDVIAALTTNRARVVEIPFPAAGVRMIRGASTEGVSLGEGVTIPWPALAPADFVRICERLPLDTTDRIGLAVFCFHHPGLEDRAHSILEGAVARDPAQKNRIDAVLARELGIEVPPAGFVLWKHRWVTPGRYHRLAEADRLARLRERLHHQDRVRRSEAIAALRNLGEPGLEILRDELPTLRDELLARLESTTTCRALAALRPAREKIAELRSEILTLVFDLEHYPTVYRQPAATKEAHQIYLTTQKRIDQTLTRLRRLWDGAESHRVILPSPFREGLRELHDVIASCHDLETPQGREGEEAAFLALLDPGMREISAQDFPLRASDSAWWRACRATLDANREYHGIARKDEKDLVAITNRYRMMLGRRPLLLQDALVRAARGHSAEMSTLGYFAHASPVPRNATPRDRARNEGYAPRNLGENIARGKVSAQAAQDLWLRSPPHHRNILSEEWTEQGAGRSGRYWTSDFGRR